MSAKVFISHHTATSVHIVEGIANKLESMGIPCWYAPRDTEGSYAESIMHAIRDCSVFVLVLNNPASESAHVLNELNAITERIARKEDVAVIPFHVADDEISDQARYYIGRMNWIDAMTPPMYLRVDELAKKVAAMLQKHIPETAPQEVSASAQYTLVSRLPEARDNFMGRDTLIEDIAAHFSSGEHILFLEGIGGIGKSELAKQYYLRHRTNYDHVLFLTYQTDLCDLVCDDSALHVQGLSRQQSESDQDYFRRKLGVFRTLCTPRTLLIIDNFDVNTDPDLDEILCSQCHILFTTRNAHPGHRSLKVECIRDEQVLRSIFESHYGDTVSEEEWPLLREIFTMIEYHTYALELIAKQMAASFLSVADMHEILVKGSLRDVDGESVDGRTDAKSAFAHICSLFNVFSLSDQEKGLLRHLSLLGIEGAPAPAFKRWLQLRSFDTVNELIKKGWVRRGPGQRLSLHPLVSEVVHAELNPCIDTCFQMVDAIAAYCSECWYHSYEENSRILPCVQSILRYAEPLQGGQFQILEPLVEFLWIQSHYDDSVSYGLQLYEACRRDLGENDPQTAFAAKTLGGCYYNCRRVEESIPWFHRALDSMLQGGPQYELDLAMCYEKSARCYSWVWDRDFEKALEQFEQSRLLREKVMAQSRQGQEIPTVLKYSKTNYRELEILYGETFLEMGRMYQLKGDYENALVYNDKYRACILCHEDYSRELLAFIDIDHGVCLLHLAREKLKAGKTDAANQDLETAVTCLQSALDINRSCHGDTAMDSIDSQEYLADAYALLKRYNEASNGYMAVIAMVEKALGRDDPRIDRVKRKMDFTQEFPEEERPLFL